MNTWDNSSRIIPTHYDNVDPWRNNPIWDQRRPLWADRSPRFSSPPRWDNVPTWEMAPFQQAPMQSSLQSTPPFPTAFPTTLATPSNDFYPISQRRFGGNMDVEMKRMNDEMQRMMSGMGQMAPMGNMGNIDDMRLSENFRMENPIQTYQDGTRKFHLDFDLRQFKPEEIQVKTAGNTLTVSARHEEKDTGKAVFREYNRSYVIPKDVAPERLTSKLSTGGMLTIEAPLPAIENAREKLIPIKHN